MRQAGSNVVRVPRLEGRVDRHAEATIAPADAPAYWSTASGFVELLLRLAGSSIIEGALIHSVLIFGGQATQGSIDAILPCQSDATIAGDPAGGFSLGTTGTDEYGNKIGEPEKGASTVRVRYTVSDGHEQVGQTVACTLLSPDMAMGSHVDIRFRPETPEDILLEKDLDIYRTIAASAWTVTGILVLCIVSFVAPLRSRDVHGELRALGN